MIHAQKCKCVSWIHFVLGEGLKIHIYIVFIFSLQSLVSRLRWRHGVVAGVGVACWRIAAPSPAWTERRVNAHVHGSPRRRSGDVSWGSPPWGWSGGSGNSVQRCFHAAVAARRGFQNWVLKWWGRGRGEQLLPPVGARAPLFKYLQRLSFKESWRPDRMRARSVLLWGRFIFFMIPFCPKLEMRSCSLNWPAPPVSQRHGLSKQWQVLLISISRCWTCPTFKVSDLFVPSVCSRLKFLRESQEYFDDNVNKVKSRGLLAIM